jgi:phospholipase C
MRPKSSTVRARFVRFAAAVTAATAAAAVAGLAGCLGPHVTPSVASPAAGARSADKPTTPIRHIVIVVQENRSFDNLFSTFPYADGTLTGEAAAVPSSDQSQCPIAQKESVPLAKKNLAVGDDFGHKYADFLVDYAGGAMDGFDLDPIPGNPSKIACLHPYQYADPAQITPYWDIAQQYVLADHMYQTQASGSFTAHQDLIAGGTAISTAASIIDDPTGFPWGCDSPPNTKTSLITIGGQYEPNEGPFPCFNQYSTLRDALDAANIPWKYYTQPVIQYVDNAGIWNAFDAIEAVRHSHEWGKRVTKSDLEIFNDIKRKRLPDVSWVTPDAVNSDHPQELQGGKDVDYGPSWVASIVNAVGTSSYWKSSAIVILWDDWGGFYDHESPAFFDDQGGLGFRVPLLVVSPYAKAGYISHTQYETASIVKFVEGNWNLPPMQLPDDRATSISDTFDFSQKPRTFTVISAPHPLAFFLQQRPSNRPPDSE